MEKIAQLENIYRKIDASKFPFFLNDQELSDAPVRKSHLERGPFTKPDIKLDYLNPQMPSSQRHWGIDIDYFDLIRTGLLPAPTGLKLNRNLSTGFVDISSFTQIHVQNSTETCTNSTSLTREPAPFNNFVRGKSTHLPFKPGGMDIKNTKKHVKFDQLESIPPGFDRGMHFGFKQATSIDINEILIGNDEIIQQLLEPELKEENEVLEEKDVDDILPNNTSIIKSKVEEAPKLQTRQWAHIVDVNLDFPEFHDVVPKLAHSFPFELDIFQKRAVYHLEMGESVFVAAHTSAGKTVVAEYAIALAMKHMTRVIYTSPIKALSNQKFRDFKNIFEDVGILTGDVQINPEAACLVMTTEILRSMLYRGADLIRDVEFVIFDEVHYLSDIDRGVVWEEAIIMLPEHVNLICLSATVPNTREFADWIGRTKEKDIYVISTLKRPVPLEHHLYIDKKLYKIVDEHKKFNPFEYRKAYEVANPPKDATKDAKRGRGADRGRGRGQTSGGRKPTNNFAVDKNLYVHLLAMLKKQSLLPAIVFTFSKKKCEEYANTLNNTDMTTDSSEKAEIHLFFERSLACLKGSDKELPQVLRVRDLLMRGIAVHHGGLLPILKEVVEILFTRGLVKVLFATETFAMGVNAPAKCVIFSMLRKHDGTQFRELLPGEYTQMSGRAGRRGLDTTGMVIIACSNSVPDQLCLNTMILGAPTKLTSQFKVTYNMILNLLRVEAIKVEDMIKRSFSENDAQKAMPERQKMQEQTKSMLKSILKLECSICSDMDEFYSLSSHILQLGYQSMEFIINSPYGIKALSPGRVVVINNVMYRNTIGVIVRVGSASGTTTSTKEEKVFFCLLLSQEEDMIYPFTRLSIPKQKVGSLELLPYTAISVITSRVIKINPESIIKNKNDNYALDELYLILKEFDQAECIPEQDWSKIRLVDFQHLQREKQRALAEIRLCQCRVCPDLISHYNMKHNERMLVQKAAELAHSLSDQNLELLPEYNQRVAILKELSFIDNNQVVQIKGRVACEINTADELLLTELTLNNFWQEYDPAEVVALLSCFVFQEKSELEPVLTPRLEKGVAEIRSLATKLAEIQKDFGLVISTEDYLAEIRLGLVEVIYEWARGLEFKKITELTDVLEGILF